MNIQLEAIFEQGVFRPLQPVELPEHQRVLLAVDTAGHAPPESADQTEFTLSPEGWQRFCEALDAPPRDIPALRKLLTEATVFDGNGSLNS
jgi:predicted DNA-binding antitoxin AbrB/MazE fold protein